MSAPFNKDSIVLSIINQLNIQNKVVISTLKGIINNAIIIDYDSIKLLSKSIKEHLKNNSIEAQHSKVLNIIAKALGYQNHHSLKSNLTIEPKDTIAIDIINDSTLKKFFILKDEFINKFGIEQLSLSHYVHKGHEFDFIYHKPGMGLRNKEKVELNKYLKSHNIKVYKNTIALCKIKYKNIYTVAFNILQHYQSFFQSIWYENNNTLNDYEYIRDDWHPMAYSDIQINNGLLIVDSHSTDLPWNIITNFLDYIFNFGTLQDIEFFEKCLKQDYCTKYPRRTKTLREVSQIRKWENQEVLKSIVKNKTQTIRDTLENVEYKIGIQKYMFPYYQEFKEKSKTTIKQIIIDTCEYFFNLNKKYTLDAIENNLFNVLTGLSKDRYIEHMEEFDDISIYKIYDDRYNSIKHLASEVKYFIKRYEDVEVNYAELYKQYRKKGYMYL